VDGGELRDLFRQSGFIVALDVQELRLK
jgi:hypothetical protein